MQCDHGNLVRTPPTQLTAPRPLGDRIFQIAAAAAGLLVLVILVLIAVSTSQRGRPWFAAEGLTGIFSNNWDPASGQFGALAFIYGTLLTSAIAIVLAVPVSLGIALLHDRGRPVPVRAADRVRDRPARRGPVGGLGPVGHPGVRARGSQRIYASIASRGRRHPGARRRCSARPRAAPSFFTAGLILAVMITPIVTSLSREVIATVPPIEQEGAYALGATRWEMIPGAVWPHSQGGIVGAVMLGLGRAMGETIAAALVIGSSAADHRRTCSHRATRCPRSSRTSSARPPASSAPALIGLGVRAVRAHDHRQHRSPARSCERSDRRSRGAPDGRHRTRAGHRPAASREAWRRTKNRIATGLMVVVVRARRSSRSGSCCTRSSPRAAQRHQLDFLTGADPAAGRPPATGGDGAGHASARS